LVIRESILELS